jgi:acetyltransferase-like isoleucine patch superfamily enzyme
VDQPLRTAPVRVGDETLIGMGAVIQPGVTIGKHCVIGANSVATKDVPNYSIAVGAPARVVKRFDNAQKGRG